MGVGVFFCCPLKRLPLQNVERKGERKHERQDFRRFAASGTILYASHRNSSGSGSASGFGSSFTNATTIETYGLEKILGDGTILHALLYHEQSRKCGI